VSKVRRRLLPPASAKRTEKTSPREPSARRPGVPQRPGGWDERPSSTAGARWQGQSVAPLNRAEDLVQADTATRAGASGRVCSAAADAPTERSRHHAAASAAKTRIPQVLLAGSSPRPIARRIERASTRSRSADSAAVNTAVASRSSKGVARPELMGERRSSFSESANRARHPRRVACVRRGPSQHGPKRTHEGPKSNGSERSAYRRERKNPAVAGFSYKPSDGLEPSTPSLPSKLVRVAVSPGVQNVR